MFHSPMDMNESTFKDLARAARDGMPVVFDIAIPNLNTRRIKSRGETYEEMAIMARLNHMYQSSRFGDPVPDYLRLEVRSADQLVQYLNAIKAGAHPQTSPVLINYKGFVRPLQDMRLDHGCADVGFLQNLVRHADRSVEKKRIKQHINLPYWMRLKVDTNAGVSVSPDNSWAFPCEIMDARCDKMRASFVRPVIIAHEEARDVIRYWIQSDMPVVNVLAVTDELQLRADVRSGRQMIEFSVHVHSAKQIRGAAATPALTPTLAGPVQGSFRFTG